MDNVNVNKIDNVINKNLEKIQKSYNFSKFEEYYVAYKNIVFDYYVVLIIFFIFVVPMIYSKIGIENKTKFYSWLIFILIILLGLNALILSLWRTYVPSGRLSKVNDCLASSSQVIFNKLNKPIEYYTKYLDKPFNEFYINTSHNTYLPCTQNADISSTEAIKRALGMGARVIELDCYARNNKGTNPEDFEPVVAHGVERKDGDIFTTTPISFEECIDIIATYGFLTSDPLIIDIEMNTNKIPQTQKIMKEIILKKLNKWLLPKEYKIINTDNRKIFIDEPIKNLLNKVIIVSGNGYVEDFKDVLDAAYYSDKLMNADHKDSRVITKENKPGVIQRIYPAGDIEGALSFNYDPTIFWKNKCQLVALNFQKFDDNLMKNIAFFKNCSFIHFSQVN